jgi:hypothetical protein
MQLRNTSAGGGEVAGGRRFSTPALQANERRRIINQGTTVGNNMGARVNPNVGLTADEIEEAFYRRTPKSGIGSQFYGGSNDNNYYGFSGGATFKSSTLEPTQLPTNQVVTPGAGMGDADPFIPGLEVPGRTYTNSWDAIAQGAKRGFNYAVDGDGIIRTKSIFTDRAPATEYNWLPPEGQAAYAAGRVAADFVGHGSRSFIWGAHPEDSLSRYGNKYLGEIPKNMRLPALYTAGAVMGIASGNYNPLNFEGGGAADGWAAVSADPEDPTVSTAPVYDMIIERGAFGRKGRILPWEQFRVERPDVSFEEYSKYKDYLYNKDENLLRDMTFGLAKGTLDGINGPELNVMGYSVTPAGAAAALGTLVGAKYLYKNRMANLL